MSAFSKLQAYSFASMLSRPFTEWDAFDLGLIDADGAVVRPTKTREEKRALGTFENLVRKVKRLLMRYVPDKKLFGFLIATYLLKTESAKGDFFYEFDESITEKERKLLYSILSIMKEGGIS
jgi:hypothetical protein